MVGVGVAVQRVGVALRAGVIVVGAAMRVGLA
jgi:hypothetical protein